MFLDGAPTPADRTDPRTTTGGPEAARRIDSGAVVRQDAGVTVETAEPSGAPAGTASFVPTSRLTSRAA